MDERSSVENSNASSTNENRPDQVVPKIVRPYHALRNLHGHRTVLVVASETTLNIPDDLKTFTEGENGVSVHFTKKLPLANSRHPPIDVIVLVYKVFHKDSFQTIKDSLPYIDIQYMIGKCFILVTSDSKFCRTDVAEIEDFAGAYCLPIHFVLKEKDREGVQRLQIPSNLMALYCPRSGKDTNSLLANATLVRSARWCTPSEK
ncbi:centromere protein M isoform X1 [Biomphalaria pfeifferi]|uniref:Centromere protein M n=1 Tax=Biomphalaria pfeifferi TaxID=112525 RepID=A0AAD8F731_BIOPF|nr:centromere protein M isoform X1 [Biomphalaria pfeifferi]